MEVAYEIFYHTKVVSEDLAEIGASDRARIKKAIEDKLTKSPETFGRPLRRSLRGYRKLRVGDYRVVFRIASPKIYILAIKHRSVIYKEILKRF